MMQLKNIRGTLSLRIIIDLWPYFLRKFLINAGAILGGQVLIKGKTLGHIPIK